MKDHCDFFVPEISHYWYFLFKFLGRRKRDSWWSYHLCPGIAEPCFGCRAHQRTALQVLRASVCGPIERESAFTPYKDGVFLLQTQTLRTQRQCPEEFILRFTS